MNGANQRLLRARAGRTAARTTCRASTCPARSPARSPRRSPAPISRRRQRLLDPHGEHDRAGAFPALGRRRAGLESGPLFGVQFSQLPCSDLSPRFNGTAGAGALHRPEALAARPRRRRRRLPALQERRGGRRHRRHGRRRLRLRPRSPRRRPGRRGDHRARRDRPASPRPTTIRADRITVDGTLAALLRRDRRPTCCSNPAARARASARSTARRAR